MNTSPAMRDLARLLLEYEAFADKTSEQAEPATLRVYEKLRWTLITFSGVASFYSLASRALVLASSEVPTLRAARLSSDGSLEGLSEFKSQTDLDRVQSGEFPAGEEGTILIATLLSLLHVLLGEALTWHLLRDAWPGAALDDRNSGNGRKS